jgi:UDP-N-acetyl-D-mannosaminuronic acid transferase (WecB/TagA/CpsF family)
MPKHHLIASRLHERWRGAFAGRPTVLLLGQAPEFAVGLVRRAPPWMQRSGLEWVWRLADDPRRLAKRYLVDDVGFLRLFWREWRSNASGRRARSWPAKPGSARAEER